MNFDRKILRWNGWGRYDEGFDLEGRDDAVWSWISETVGMPTLVENLGPKAVDIELPISQLNEKQVGELKSLLSEEQVKIDPYERAFHAKGQSFHDLIRLRQEKKVEMAPDAVLYPENEEQVLSVVTYAKLNNFALIPFGGGSSVVGGVEAACKEGQRGVLVLDTTRMNRLISIDAQSMTATFETGIYGPELEAILKDKGYTLGHYPQSFEFSTLGGWIAARGAGQQSTKYGKAEKWLVGARVVTPTGLWQTEDFPASAAGPDLRHLVAGSEGALGVITQATVRLHKAPEFDDYRGYLFKDFESGAAMVRDILQQGVQAATVRLSDTDETRFLTTFSGLGKKKGLGERLIKRWLGANGYGTSPCLMILGFEGDMGVARFAERQTHAISKKHKAFPLGRAAGKKWYEGRFKMPYMRDPLLDRGVAVDTLETATSWSNLSNLHTAVSSALNQAMEQNKAFEGAKGIVMAHISHAYETGASLYFTYVYPVDPANGPGQWRTIKQAVSNAVSQNGGTISHHHGVGTDHLEWLEKEKGEVGLNALKAIKKKLDPNGVMNPGKLVV
ncbi:MAG: FAD-binding oxidoreductase [Rhodospirillales bacterium]|nr:FAD-binding oxidoreductase [Rhodospirillales bacterium]